jgi:hypothetical protein
LLLRRLLQVQLRAERERRRGQCKARRPFDATALLSEPQRIRARHPSRFKALPAGRQSGKTDLVEKILLEVASARPGEQAIYASTSIKRAVATIWDELVLFNQTQRLGGVVNQTRHTISFPGAGKAVVTGVENKRMANAIRGLKRVALYIVDEAQDWPDDLLKYFYQDVIYPSLAAVRGGVIFAGTGGPPRGFWYEVATRDAGFVRFGPWTPHDNPFLPVGEAQALIDKACKDRGVDESDPSIRREFRAEFVVDLQRQIFNYDEKRNGYNRGTWDPAHRMWTGGDLPAVRLHHVVGADFGTVDACGIVIWGYHEDFPYRWVLETDRQAGLSSSGQVAMVRAYVGKYGGVVASVGDPGGGGAGHIVDLRQEHLIPMDAAEKLGKASGCILLRDGLRTGVVKVARDEAAFIDELAIPEWDPTAVGQVTRGHFPDRCDAGLYGYRKLATLHHYREPPPTDTKSALHKYLES